jgi:arsenite-transporting ATPase
MFDEVIARLQDPARTAFVFVVYPEHTPIVEAHRAALQLESIGIDPAMVIANQVLPDDSRAGGFFAQRRKTQMRHMDEISELFKAPIVNFPLLAEEPRGIEALRAAPISFS